MYSQFLCIHVCTGSRLSSAVLSRGVKASKPAQESNMAMVFPFFPIQPPFLGGCPIEKCQFAPASELAHHIQQWLQWWKTTRRNGRSTWQGLPSWVLGGFPSSPGWLEYIILYHIILYFILFYYRRKFRSQTSDNMDRWKAEMGRVREEKRREEKRREEKRRRKKITKKKVPEERRSRCAKR